MFLDFNRWQGLGSTHENTLALRVVPSGTKLLLRLTARKSLSTEAQQGFSLGTAQPLPRFEPYETSLSNNTSISCSIAVILGYCMKLLVSCCVTDIEKGFINGV